MFYHNYRLVLSLVLATLLPTNLLAQSKVGTAMVDGKKVELLSDQSWRYLDGDVEERCVSISVRVDFCGLGDGWQRLKSDNPELSAQFSFDDRNYGVFIIEDIGADDGVTHEFMLDMAIENFSGAAGVQKEDIVVFDLEDGEFNGLPIKTITYGGKLEGLTIVMRNTIIIKNDITIQAANYSIAVEVTEDLLRLHDDLLAATILK